MSNLQNFRSENWNVPPTGQLNSTNMPNLMTNTMPSLRSLATLGGGDAPPFTPRMRSPLFTISTRSITASHSELNVRYTTTEANLNQHRLLSETEIDESNSEIKAINSESPIQSYATSSNIHLKSRNFTEKERNYAPLRRCLHGSIEDLHQASNSTSVNDVKSKNKRKSAPNPSCRGQMIEAANELLVEENKHLTNTIQKTKRKLLVTKIATCFALEALKRRGKVIKKLETLNFEKKQQCAARLILHSLLLNSWRNTRRDLDLRLDDNAELRKSVENFTLQVQVLRHVQSNEKQKSQEKTNLIQHMNDELKIIKEENQIMRKEIEKMENELNSLQASTQNLTDENALLKREITSMIDRKDVLTQSLERERMKSDVFEKENKSMKETVNR
ncbi:unnamed protein product [Orchesella dallaii]|uniref:Uncharacterized protein n=1 Tax=Orchesella dallaii TaxID=48710 RepID=A0ABP1QFE6_9HEXA